MKYISKLLFLFLTYIISANPLQAQSAIDLSIIPPNATTMVSIEWGKLMEKTAAKIDHPIWNHIYSATYATNLDLLIEGILNFETQDKSSLIKSGNKALAWVVIDSINNGKPIPTYAWSLPLRRNAGNEIHELVKKVYDNQTIQRTGDINYLFVGTQTLIAWDSYHFMVFGSLDSYNHSGYDLMRADEDTSSQYALPNIPASIENQFNIYIKNKDAAKKHHASISTSIEALAKADLGIWILGNQEEEITEHITITGDFTTNSLIGKTYLHKKSIESYNLLTTKRIDPSIFKYVDPSKMGFYGFITLRQHQIREIPEKHKQPALWGDLINTLKRYPEPYNYFYALEQVANDRIGQYFKGDIFIGVTGFDIYKTISMSIVGMSSSKSEQILPTIVLSLPIIENSQENLDNALMELNKNNSDAYMLQRKKEKKGLIYYHIPASWIFPSLYAVLTPEMLFVSFDENLIAQIIRKKGKPIVKSSPSEYNAYNVRLHIDVPFLLEQLKNLPKNMDSNNFQTNLETANWNRVDLQQFRLKDGYIEQRLHLDINEIGWQDDLKNILDALLYNYIY